MRVLYEESMCGVCGGCEGSAPGVYYEGEAWGVAWLLGFCGVGCDEQNGQISEELIEAHFGVIEIESIYTNEEY